MDLAYQAATVIASRAGAMSIAELALVGKAAILVLSPMWQKTTKRTTPAA